ncbi:hypothetical protein J7I84_19105, partial [Arthrobacter sp. ISL-85]|uniref:hypothetical protein n=1 Tax=Arthrobacter sp. ISL-85 TaxID=2819115 RepID=UPI001BE9D598
LVNESMRTALASTRATAAFLSTDWFRESVIKPAVREATVDGLFETLRGLHGAGQLTEEIDDIFSEIPGSRLLLGEAEQQLSLVLPFGHDLAVRRALQIVVMIAVAAANFRHQPASRSSPSHIGGRGYSKADGNLEGSRQRV